MKVIEGTPPADASAMRHFESLIWRDREIRFDVANPLAALSTGEVHFPISYDAQSLAMPIMPIMCTVFLNFGPPGARFCMVLMYLTTLIGDHRLTCRRRGHQRKQWR